MAITVPATGSAAATTVTLPTHAIGDLILITARGTAAAPSIPAAGGTVPTWTSIQSGLANSMGLTTAATVATSASHTSGTWTNATHILVLVIRSDTAPLQLGVSATGNANNTQTLVYPALSSTRVSGMSSLAVRSGTRTVADTEVRTSTGFTTGGTFQAEQPATTPLMAAFTKTITADEGSFSATTAGSNAASRAHSVEVIEVLPLTLTMPPRRVTP